MPRVRVLLKVRKLLLTVLGLACGWLFLNGLFYVLAPKVVFLPSAETFFAPDKSFPHAFEDVYFPSGDHQLHGWWFEKTSATGTVVFFHGNAGNISHRQSTIELILSLPVNLFIFDYSGYGKSQGQASEKAIYRDAHAAWTFVTGTKQVPADQVYLWGRSLGGSAAVHLALDKPIRGLIMESTFTNAAAMANRLLPLLSRTLLLRYKLNNLGKIKKIRAPVLIIHSRDDEMIPFHMGTTLFKQAPEPKTFLSISGDHNNGFFENSKTYLNTVSHFMATAKPAD